MPAREPQRFRTPLPEAEFSYTVGQNIIRGCVGTEGSELGQPGPPTHPLKIVDLSLGANSVTNDAENVLRKIERRHPGLIADYRIMYRDSLGVWDGMEWDGLEVRFFPIRETDERAAERKLKLLRPRPVDRE